MAKDECLFPAIVLAGSLIGSLGGMVIRGMISQASNAEGIFMGSMVGVSIGGILFGGLGYALKHKFKGRFNPLQDRDVDQEGLIMVPMPLAQTVALESHLPLARLAPLEAGKPAREFNRRVSV